MDNPKLYLETSLLSYLTAKPSRDLIAQGHQEITLEWWETKLEYYEVFISDLVLAEASLGDRSASSRRIALVEPFQVLVETQEVRQLAGIYAKEIPLPPSVDADAVHLAFATSYGMDFLLTWNCRHIANGNVIRRVTEINSRLGFKSPVVCTPEELLYGI